MRNSNNFNALTLIELIVLSMFWYLTQLHLCVYCSVAGGELFERIVDDSYEHTEVSSVGYMRQILEGIQYMHQKNIVHLDLKPENIVCMDRTGIRIKIIDFGLASKLGMNVLMILSTQHHMLYS